MHPEGEEPSNPFNYFSRGQRAAKVVLDHGTTVGVNLLMVVSAAN